MKMKNIFALRLIIIILSVCAVAVSALLMISDPQNHIVWIICSLCIASVVALLVEVVISSKNLRKYITQMDKEIALTERESLYNFPAPAIIIDDENVIVWYNRLFEDTMYSDNEAYGVHITDLIEVDIAKICSESGYIISHEDKYFRVLGKKPAEDVGLTMVYFEDITDYVLLEREHRLSHPTVLLLMVDNYDDLLTNAKESEKAHVLVETEKLLEAFMENTTGILRKLSNDRFVAVLEERHLAKIIDGRFEILDKARSIMVNDRLNVTLSIGVGKGASTLIESEGLARQALDMCLGRGGDQAAVKTENGFEFFGGVSKGIEKRTKVKTRIIANALKELIEAAPNVLIMGHQLGDLDSMGSATALCCVIRKMGVVANVVFRENRTLAKPLTDYIKENSAKDYYICPENALPLVSADTLVIITDTHNPEFLDSREIYEKASKVVVIDHHRKMVNYIDNAVIFHHEPYASSASEMVAELIQYFGDAGKIPAPEAEALLAGIMLDTKNFVMRTGVRTFEAAAFLRKQGADTVAVKSMFSNSAETYQEKSKLITNAGIYKECAIAGVKSNAEVMRIAAPQAADELLGISGVKASFVLYESNGTTSISARSMGSFNVQLIMEALGGGGHQTMAGAQLACPLAETTEKLEAAIDEFLNNSNM